MSIYLTRYLKERPALQYLDIRLERVGITLDQVIEYDLQFAPQDLDSAHIEPGREGLFNLIKSIPPTLKYEPGTIVTDGDFVIGTRTVFWLRPACELDCS